MLNAMRMFAVNIELAWSNTDGNYIAVTGPPTDSPYAGQTAFASFRSDSGTATGMPFNRDFSFNLDIDLSSIAGIMICVGSALVPLTPEACEVAAIANGLSLGGNGREFVGAYGQRGCYTYVSGEYLGMAFFGTLRDGDDPDLLRSTELSGTRKTRLPCDLLRVVTSTETPAATVSAGAVIERSQTDTGVVANFFDLGLVFQGSGTVTAWNLWANAPGSVRLQVWRERGGTGGGCGSAIDTIAPTIVSPYSINWDANPTGQIQDGGGDMYDGGNRITTSLCSNRLSPYTDNMEQVASDCFGADGMYMMDIGLAMMVLVTQNTGSDELQILISGNLGADGSGTHVASEYTSGTLKGYMTSVCE